MTIQEIIKKLNELDGASKNMPSSMWLYEVGKYEDLFCSHPDADKTCTYNGRLVMKSDVTLEQLGYSKQQLKENGLL